MEHGLDTGALAVVAGCFVLWGLVSGRLERLKVSAPIAFVVFGLVVAHEPLSLLDVHIHSSTARGIAEITLALAALIGAIVAPTDAALGASIMQDERVPARVLGGGWVTARTHGHPPTLVQRGRSSR